MRSRELCPGVVPLTWQGNFICKLKLFSLSLIAVICRAIIIGKTSWSEKAKILSKSSYLPIDDDVEYLGRFEILMYTF